MIITCPSCQSQFMVPVNAIPPQGRTVKCSKCAHSWHQDSPEQQLNPDAASVKPEVKAIPKGSNLPAIRSKRPIMGWLVSGMLLLFIAAFLWSVSNVTPVAKMVGITDTAGIGFTSFTVDKIRNGSRLSMTIKGEIHNSSEQKKAFPEIKVLVLSKGGLEMGSTIIPQPQPDIMPDETVELTHTLENISGLAESIQLEMGNGWELYFR